MFDWDAVTVEGLLITLIVLQFMYAWGFNIAMEKVTAHLSGIEGQLRWMNRDE